MSLALVYRGPAAVPGCPEAVASLLSKAPQKFTIKYVGPRENLKLTATTLASATIYAQPGGGSLSHGWKYMKEYSSIIRTWVSSGGRYLGFCLGGYLAGSTPGFNLLNGGDTDEYIIQDGATVDTDEDTTVEVNWLGKRRKIFFQDGPIFILKNGVTLAKYLNGDIAAAVVPFGKGKVGITGPHPEADPSWFSPSNPVISPLAYDLGLNLIATTTS